MEVTPSYVLSPGQLEGRGPQLIWQMGPRGSVGSAEGPRHAPEREVLGFHPAVFTPKAQTNGLGASREETQGPWGWSAAETPGPHEVNSAAPL